MRIRTLSRPDLSGALVLGGALSALTAAILWTQILIRQWPALTAGGVICGAEPGFLGHCAACLPAIGASAVAAACAGVLIALRRR